MMADSQDGKYLDFFVVSLGVVAILEEEETTNNDNEKNKKNILNLGLMLFVPLDKTLTKPPFRQNEMNYNIYKI